MPKIKIIKGEIELEGDVVGKVVTPFGTSAHIPFSKKHTGKNVEVVIPKNPHYSWVLSKADLKHFIEVCKKTISKGDAKLMRHKLDRLKRIEKGKFLLEDLEYFCILLEEEKQGLELVKKIRRIIDFS